MTAHTPWSFVGRTALVTGAARGIGLAVVQQLAAGGANVAGWDVPGADWAAASAAAGGRWLALHGDVSLPRRPKPRFRPSFFDAAH